MKRAFFGRRAAQPDVSGELLVADFMSVQANLATMEVAAAEAQASEANVTNALQYAASMHGGTLLQPNDISALAAGSLVKDSVDAHLKKVQAAQIQTFTAAQVTDLQQVDLARYKGKHVRVAKLNEAKDVLVPLWTDNRSGQLRHGTYNGKTITGTIDDLSLENNVLVIRPTLTARTLVPGRKYFLVYVVDYQTWSPHVRIDIV